MRRTSDYFQAEIYLPIMKLTTAQLKQIIAEEIKRAQLTEEIGMGTVNQLRKIIREEVEKNLSEAKFKVGDKVEEKGTDSGWWEILELIPDKRAGKTAAKLKMFSPTGGRTTTTYVNTDKLTKVRESVSRPGSSPLKDGGVVNRDSGEILDMDSVPQKYLDHVEVDEMGYTTLPNEQFEELRGELKGIPRSTGCSR